MARLEQFRHIGLNYVEKMHNILTAASNQSMIRPLLNQATLKKLNDSFRQKDYELHYEIALTENAFIRLSNEIENSKHYSVVVYIVSEIMKEAGIYEIDADEIRKRGTKVFNINKTQMAELNEIFSTHPKLRSLVKALENRSEEMDTFRNKHSLNAKAAKAQGKGKDQSEAVDDFNKVIDHTKKLNERYEKISSTDKDLQPEVVKRMVSTNPPELYQKVNSSTNCREFIEAVNDFLVDGLAPKEYRI